jgi:hypothetical protein
VGSSARGRPGSAPAAMAVAASSVRRFIGLFPSRYRAGRM